MKYSLKKILFIFALTIGVSITASAQKDGDKNPPPKKDPPIVVVEPKKTPKDDKPNGKKRPEALMFRNEDETVFE